MRAIALMTIGTLLSCSSGGPGGPGEDCTYRPGDKCPLVHVTMRVVGGTVDWKSGDTTTTGVQAISYPKDPSLKVGRCTVLGPGYYGPYATDLDTDVSIMCEVPGRSVQLFLDDLGDVRQWPVSSVRHVHARYETVDTGIGGAHCEARFETDVSISVTSQVGSSQPPPAFVDASWRRTVHIESAPGPHDYETYGAPVPTGCPPMQMRFAIDLEQTTIDYERHPDELCYCGA